MTHKRSSFWKSLPGLLTALAALIGACATLLALLVGGGSAANGRAHVSLSRGSGRGGTSIQRGTTLGSGSSGAGSSGGGSPGGGTSGGGSPGGGTSGGGISGGATNPAGGRHVSSGAAGTGVSGSPEAGFRAETDLVRADPFAGSVTCPVTVTFTAVISVTQGSGVVSYRWLRSDGAAAPVQALTFSQPGSQTVTSTWQLGAPGASLSQWEAVELLSPVTVTSNHAAFTL